MKDKGKRNKYFINCMKLVKRLHNNREDRKLFTRISVYYTYHWGVFLGLSVANKLSKIEFDTLMKELDNRLTKKVTTCVSWFWEKHKHNKFCYKKEWKEWEDL